MKKSGSANPVSGKFNLSKIEKLAGVILLFAAIAVHIYFVRDLQFTQDDAYITFRYAENYVNGHGLVYNIGEKVEGYTNFLWLLFMILGREAGGDYISISQILGTLFGVAGIFVVFLCGLNIFKSDYLSAGLATIILGTVYSYAYWTIASLETAAFACMVVLSVYFLIIRSPMMAVTSILASLLRPEGALVFAVLILYELIVQRRLTRDIVMLISIYALPLIPYAVFKWSYFGGIFPNPFYAKTDFTWGQLSRGAEYTWQFLRHYAGFGLFLIPFLVVYRKWNRHILAPAFLTLLYTFYIMIIGGDVLQVHRFFVPLFPLYALIMVFGFINLLKWKHAAILGALIVIVWQLYAPWDHVLTYWKAERGLAATMDNLIGQLKNADDTDFTLAVSTIGLVGYKLMGHTVIDMLGLTDSTIARHPEEPVEGIESTWKETKYNAQYLLTRQPKYILFSTGNKPSAPAEFALFTYSRFLTNYRPVGFYYNNYVHDFYKLMEPITPPVERDVNVLFGRLYNEGVNQWRRKELDGAQETFEKLVRYSPRPIYPYIYYYLAEISRNRNDNASAYKIELLGSQQDTNFYLIERDLYVYERGFRRNPEAAEIHMEHLRRLVPWYVERVEKIAEDMEKEIEAYQERTGETIIP